MLEDNEGYFKANGEPLFSSHMLDLSEEFDEENIATYAKYFKRVAAVNLWLEMEIGITGGEVVRRMELTTAESRLSLSSPS